MDYAEYRILQGTYSKSRGWPGAVSIIDKHRVSSFQGRTGPLSYKLKLIAKKSISYRSEFDSRGSSTPLGLRPGELNIMKSIKYYEIHEIL